MEMGEGEITLSPEWTPVVREVAQVVKYKTQPRMHMGGIDPLERGSMLSQPACTLAGAKQADKAPNCETADRKKIFNSNLHMKK